MSIKIVYIFIGLLLLNSGIVSAKTWYVDDDGGSGINFTKIQDAINAAGGGDTILVYSGTYYENLDVNRQVLLAGIDSGKGQPVVDGMWSGNAIRIGIEGVTIDGFNIRNGSNEGISVRSNNNIIRNNDVSDNYRGINLFNSNNNKILNNNVGSNNGAGISLSDSGSNIISGNIANLNGKVLTGENGIGINHNSNNNLITGNMANSNGNKGIGIGESYGNIVRDNIANTNGREGIYLGQSNFTLISNNSIKSNSGAGIMLQFSDNNNISGNNASNSLDYLEGYPSSGIHLDNSNGNNLSNNIAISNSGTGISLSYSARNILINNLANSNVALGIVLFQNSNNNLLTDNIVNSNGDKGIASFGSYQNTVSRNMANFNNQEGIFLQYSNSTLIENNVLYLNECGIMLLNSSNNDITGNNASNPDGFYKNGIFLGTSDDNKISHNKFSYNTGAGIAMVISNNNTISDNLLINNEAGISIDFSSNNIIYGNNASYNIVNGIRFNDSSNNNILNSNIASNNGAGIDLSERSNYNTIINNTANFNNKWEGFFIKYSSHNILSGNTMNNNNWSGIGLKAGSNYNIIFNNNISSNKEQGIRIDSSGNNVIYHNNILNNIIQANDSDPANNNWYNITLKEGNYWSDYAGVDDGSGTGKHDFSGDHIGDTLIPHPSSGYDSYPFVYQDGWMRPAIVIFTDKTSYIAGQKMYVGLDITNPGSALKASLDIWIDLPGGGKKMIASYPSINLPAGLVYKKHPWNSITLPNLQAGNYAWHAVLKNKTSEGIISESISPWTFSSPKTAGSYEEIEFTKSDVLELQ